MLDSETARELIHPHMVVVGSEDLEFATVDHIEGSSAIMLAKDDSGQPHYIPLSWVAAVDDKVHLDRSATQARREWSTSPPRA